MRYLAVIVVFLSLSGPVSLRAGEGFTQKDRELLIALKVKMEEMDKRFEQVDKRFEQVDKRFEELRSDMNKRFEQVDKRFEQMMGFFRIMAAFSGSLIAALIGFVLWDRRTLLNEARRQSIAYMEKNSTTLKILKEYAARDEKMREVLKSFRVL